MRTASRPKDRAGRRRRAHAVVQRLTAAFGLPRLNNKSAALDELVFIVLSQMTTGPSYERVYERLKAALPNWASLIRTPQRRLIRLIRDAGLSGQKAPRLKAIARKLESDFGSVTLDPLDGMPDDDAERYLCTLPGIGAKSAKCILMYSMGRSVLPVDTHVARVARRLALVSPATRLEKIHRALEVVVRPSDRYAFHVTAVTLGRRFCRSVAPRCVVCPIASLCPSRRNNLQ